MRSVRAGGEDFAVEVQQIKSEVSQRMGCPLVKGRLQIGKTALPGRRKHHHLSIENRALDLDPAERTCHRAHAMRPVQAAAGEEANLTGLVDVRLNAIAVQFQFVDPMVAPGRGSRFRGQLRRKEGRQGLRFSRQPHRRERHCLHRRRLCGKALAWLRSFGPVRLPHVISFTRDGVHDRAG